MSIAWRAILVAGLAAGEEATLASLTGLFQREPERAAALVASAREGARAINQSRHSEGHAPAGGPGLPLEGLDGSERREA